jgi:sugar phosphate isomerase/epimerase
MFMPQLSIGTWTFTAGVCANDPVPLDTVIRRAADIGYTGIALGGFPPHGSVALYPNREARLQLMRKIHDLGLSVNSYAADLLDCDFYDGSAGALARYRDRFDRSLELCADCGIPIIRVDTVTMTPYPANFDYHRAWETIIEVFREDAEKAAAAQITAAWEFEPGRLFNKPGEIQGILQAVNHDSFTVQYDTAHGQLCAVVGAHQYGEPEVLPGGQVELIEKLAGSVGDVHLIDTDNTMRNDTNSNKVPFGAGVLDFPSLISALRSSGYQREWWTVDLGPQGGDVWKTARDAFEFVSRLFSEPTG